MIKSAFISKMKDRDPRSVRRIERKRETERERERERDWTRAERFCTSGSEKLKQWI